MLRLPASYDDLILRHEELTRSGKYLQAEEVWVEAQAVKWDSEKMLCIAFKSEQRAHVKDLREVHRKQLQEFNQAWDTRVSEYRAHAASLRAALEERWRKEGQEVVAKLHAERELRAPHWSKFYLERRRVEERLLRQRRFDEAAAVKAEADAMQETELAEFHQRREAKIQQLATSHQEWQLRQRQCFEKRVESTLENLERTRKREMGVLVSRIRNVISKVQQTQKIHATTVLANPRLHSPARLAFSAADQEEDRPESQESVGERQ